MTFTPGCAQPLYRDNIHPRLLVGPKDLAAMKRKTRAGVGAKILRDIRVHIRPVADRVLAAADENAVLDIVNGAYFGRELWHFVDELAALGKLDNDVRCIAAARRVLLAIATPREGVKPLSATGALSMIGNAFDLIHDSLSAADRATIAAWMLEHGIRGPLKEIRHGYFRGSGVNTRLVGMISGLFHLLAIQGEPNIPDLSTERDEFISMLDATLHTSHGANGFPTEDIGYGTAVTAYLTHAVEAVRRAGLYDGYTACPRLARFGNAVLHFVQPWGDYLTSTGDHYDGFMDRQFVLARQAAVNKDPSLAWLAATLHYPPDAYLPIETPIGKKLQLPASWLTLTVLDDLKPRHPRLAKKSTSYIDRTRGIASFRTGWEDDGVYVVFDGSQRSPSAQGHEHASAGNFDLTALGEYFAIETGRYNMEQNCHNVVLIDGKSGRSTNTKWSMVWHPAVMTGAEAGPFVDSASIDSSHQHDCYWARRSLGLVKGDMPYVWLVDDINKANDWAEYWWQIHTSPENVITLEEKSATIQGWRKGNCLDVHFAIPEPTRYAKPHTLSLAQDEAIGSSTSYVANPHDRASKFKRPSDMLHASVFVRPRLLAKVGGYNGRFMSILIPRKKNAAKVQVEQITTHDNSFAMRISNSKIEDTLIWAYEHQILEANGVIARGDWCVVRRARGSRKILDYAVGGTDASLRVDGRVLQLAGGVKK